MIEEAIRDLASAMRELAGAMKARADLGSVLFNPKNWRVDDRIVFYNEEVKAKHIAALQAAPVKGQEAPAPNAPPVSNEQGGVSKAEPVEAPEPEPTAEVVEAAAAAVEAAPTEIGYDEIKVLVLRLMKEKGRDAAAAVLGALGVAKATELDPAQYAQAKSALEAAL
jgi:hypothetical protein